MSTTLISENLSEASDGIEPKQEPRSTTDLPPVTMAMLSSQKSYNQETWFQAVALPLTSYVPLRHSLNGIII